MPFAQRLFAWGEYIYYSAYFVIQHWIELRAECDLPAALTPSRHRVAEVTYIC
jgi:hypothetical protein